MPQVAPGLPDPAEYGSVGELKPGALVPLFTQQHDARRAGPHLDLRLGNLKEQLLSWAVPKGMPQPGEKRLAIPQPLHEEAYGPWSGTIPAGTYGAGKVESKVRGKALVTNVDDDGVSFVTAHTRYPERFRLQQTPRGWILINATKTETRLPYEKVHFQQVDEDAVDKLFTPKNLVTAKIDGSAAFYELLGDKIEALSYRTSKATGRPIVHTERIGSPRLREKLKDTVLRGEMYGVRDNQAIPAAELGGLLNSTIELSLARQKERDIELKHAVFDILKHEGKDVRKLPYAERLKLLRGVLEKLPEQFHLPEGYTDPAQQRELWNRIRTGKDPITREGIVAHPLLAAGAVPIKAKTYPESDVIIKGIVPGKGRLKGMASGGFWYALPDDPDKIVGKVGTGLSDEDRWDMWQNPNEWVGRTARIRAQEQFPSGAYRAPAFLARHEDVTQKEAMVQPRLMVMAALLKQAAAPAKMMAPAAGQDRVSRYMAGFRQGHPAVPGVPDLPSQAREQLWSRGIVRRAQGGQSPFEQRRQPQPVKPLPQAAPAAPAKMMAPAAGSDRVSRYMAGFQFGHPPIPGGEAIGMDIARSQLRSQNFDRRSQPWLQQQPRQLQPRQPTNIGMVDAPTPASPVSPQVPQKVAAYLGGYMDKQAAAIDEAAKDTDTAPTEAQKKSGNYAKGKVSWQGLPLSIENPAGSTRSGTSAAGKKWSTQMRHHYGYILGSKGRDKDHVDVFIKPDTDSGFMVYVVNQVKPGTGAFDEHKCMLGFATKAEAEQAYLANYEKGWKGLGSIVPMPLPKFKQWALSDGPAKGALTGTEVAELTKKAFAEKTAADKRSWGWLAVKLPPALQSKVRRLVSRIDRHDLAEGGKELEPHITVAYGLEATERDKPAIRQELENFKAPAITIGGASVFENQGYKVLKLDVDSPELHRLRRHIAGKYPMPGNTHPGYHPHITLAYLKPEVDASKYLDNDLVGQQFKGGRWVFRGKREQEKVAMSTATELRRHLQKAAAEEEEELGANAVFRTKWPSDRHPGRFEHLNLGPDVTSGMEATLAVPTTVMGTVTVPRVKIPDYEAARLGWQAARGMAADVAPPLIALAALLGVGGIGGAAYWHHRKNRKRQQDESLRKKQQQEKTAMTKSQELKRRLQKAAAEVAQTQEEEAKKRKGPTFGQKLLRGGLATAAGGMAGLIGGGYGGFKLGQHASNRLQDSALRELRADHQASRSGLSSLWMPPLSEENLKAIAGAATENDRAELEGTGALGGAALGAGGGALLGLAVYFAFRRAGG